MSRVDGIRSFESPWALQAEVVAVTELQAGLAREAALRFGKGRHRAGLNLGDCFAYALAAERGEPLLFVGDDFAQTDVDPLKWQDR